MKKLFIDYNPNCVRVALSEDGELIDFSVERASMRELVGNIYKGKVENVLSGMKAAFVNIGLQRNGFLYTGDSLVDNGKVNPKRDQQTLNVSPGDVIMCQVVKEQFGMKGARLTTDITLPGYFLVLLPRSSFIGVSRKIENEERRNYLEDFVHSIAPPNMGFIVRSAADRASDEDLIVEADKLVRLWEKIQMDYYRTETCSAVFKDAMLLERAIRDTFSEDVESIVVNEPRVAHHLDGKVGEAKIEVYYGERNIMAHYGLSQQINNLASRRVDLENGAYLVIDKTEALTVIDVNTGRFVGTKDLEDTVYKTNMLAAQEIAKQLRVRNISGIVIIDFIDMTDEGHKEEVVEFLRNNLKKDRLKTTVVSMTNLGLVELTRKKANLPVDNFMLTPCTSCMGGYVISSEQLIFILRDEMIDYFIKKRPDTLLVRVNPEICDKIFETNIMYNEAQNLWKHNRVYFLADNSLNRDQFDISGSNKKILSLPPYAKMLTY